jgi:hypothetical protein
MARFSVNQINLFRILVSPLFLYYTWPLHYRVYFYISVCYLVFSVAWALVDRFMAIDYAKMPVLGYLPQTLDAMLVTLFVVLTGHVNSFAVMGYVIIVLLSAISEKRNYGLTAMIISLLFYVASGILYLFGFFRVINIFGYGTRILPAQLVVSTLILAVCLYLAYTITRSMVLKLKKLEARS